MTTGGSTRRAGRALVAGVVGTLAAASAVVLGAQVPDAAGDDAPGGGAAPGSLIRLEQPDRFGPPREPVSAEPDASSAITLQAPLLDLVTPPPTAPPAGDRTDTLASREGGRGSAGSSPSPGSEPSGPSGPPGPSASGSTRPPAPGGGGSTAAQVVSLVNAARADAGCGPVSADGALTAAAQAHSADMAAGDYFSHTSRDGRSFGDRIRAAGYGGGAIAENIAAGQSSAPAVMAAWMDSPGHRANILDCTYRHIGVGVATGGSLGTYWTQDLGG